MKRQYIKKYLNLRVWEQKNAREEEKEKEKGILVFEILEWFLLIKLSKLKKFRISETQKYELGETDYNHTVWDGEQSF